MFPTSASSTIGAPQVGADSPTETLDDRRRRWSDLLNRQHYQPVIEEVLREELPKYQHSSIIDATDTESHMRECAIILASAPSVFTAAVQGDLVSRMQNDITLQNEYEQIKIRAQDQPSIYIHLLTDDAGNAPTPDQYLIIQGMILDYLAPNAQSKHAWHIDSVTHPPSSRPESREGHRKYLQTNKQSTHRIQTLQRLCQGIQTRWQDTPPSSRDTPLPYPPGECGYSLHSHIRLAQHRAHQSSNYIMNLVEDICTYLFRSGTFSQHFVMHQFIIYLIFRSGQAAIAEMFCSGLLQVWVHNAGGFNAYPAGRSVATVRRVSVGEWEAHEEWVRGTTGLVGNMRLQREMAGRWVRALEWEDEGERGGEVRMVEEDTVVDMAVDKDV